MPIYRDIYDGPPRWYTATRTRKRYIMIHATANDASAENEASFAKRRDSRVSSHYYVDDDSIVQSLDTDFRAWHAGNDEGNDHAIAYELTARNMNVGRAWWIDLGNIEWPLMVAAIARDCRHHGITPRDLTVSQLRARELTGFCMHFEGNDAWGGSDHTDPGPNFPMDHLVRQVRAALEGDMPMTKADVDVLVNTDGVVEAPAGYPGENTHWTLANVVRSGQLFARLGFEQAREAKAGLKAVLAAVGGLDTEAILNAVNQRAAEDLARDEALMELVEQAQSGQLDAAEVVRLIGAKLTAASQVEGGA